MYEIVEAEFLAPQVKRLVIRAPRVAKKWKAGQFVIVRPHDHAERIPLTIAAVDAEAEGGGTITIIVQGIGKTTRLINELEAGDAMLDVVGPLGKASHVERFGRVVVIGGGVGTAIAYPTAIAMKQAGNHVTVITGARTKELLILEDELRAGCDELCVMTDDGSYGEQGFVTAKLQALIESGQGVDLVLAIGPIPMMRAVAEVTRGPGIKTVVSLNPIMVDGTGMCGGCRVLVDGQSEFACVDGPEFDAHLVDFGVLIQRNSLYRDQERAALTHFEESPQADEGRLIRHCQLAKAHPEMKLGADSTG